MMWLGYIGILAENDLGHVIFMVIVAVFWVVGALVSRSQKAKAQEKADRLRREKAMQNTQDEGEEDWQIIAPQQQNRPPLPQQQPRPIGMKKPSIHQFVKPRSAALHSKLTQPKMVERLQHVQAKPLPVLHAEHQLAHQQVRLAKKPLQPLAGQLKARRETQPQPVAVTKSKARSGLARLRNPKAAQTAMIFHEILAPPKALCNEPNLWD